MKRTMSYTTASDNNNDESSANNNNNKRQCVEYHKEIAAELRKKFAARITPLVDSMLAQMQQLHKIDEEMIKDTKERLGEATTDDNNNDLDVLNVVYNTFTKPDGSSFDDCAESFAKLIRFAQKHVPKAVEVSSSD